MCNIKHFSNCLRAKSTFSPHHKIFLLEIVLIVTLDLMIFYGLCSSHLQAHYISRMGQGAETIFINLQQEGNLGNDSVKIKSFLSCSARCLFKFRI